MPSSFKEKVLKVVQNIPKGKTMSYKEVARRAGNKKAARAVGQILGQNFDPKIPCHRAIRSDGGPGGYNRGWMVKIRLLQEEGAI